MLIHVTQKLRWILKLVLNLGITVLDLTSDEYFGSSHVTVESAQNLACEKITIKMS